MTRLAHYLIASEWRAAVIASVLLVLPVVSWMGAAVVGLYALRRGASRAPWVTGLPLVVAVVMAFGFGDSSALIVLLLTLGLAVILQATASWVSVLQVTLALALGLVMVMDTLYRDVLDALVSAIKGLVSTPEQLLQMGVDGAVIDAWMGSLAVGALSFVHLVTALFALLGARALQARGFNPGGFKAEFEAIRLPAVFAVGCLVLMVAGFVAGPWLVRFSPVAALPLMVAGFALVHGLTGMRESKALLIMFYAALLVLTPYLLLLLAFLAVIDAFVDFRTRARQEPPQDEDE